MLSDSHIEVKVSDQRIGFENQKKQCKTLLTHVTAIKVAPKLRGHGLVTPPHLEQNALSCSIRFDANDFVGADMAKKYLHMGFTRARRYANHRDGRKYNPDGTEIPQEPDALTCEKAHSAKVFYACWVEARQDKKYLKMKQAHKRSKNVLDNMKT